MKPTLPPKRKGMFSGAKPATSSDLFWCAQFLNVLLSSPALCKEAFVFDELGFDEDLKLLIRSMSVHKLDALHSIADQPFIRDPTRLLNKTGSDYEFHSVYIAKRPLSDRSLKLFNFQHWSLKMEGKHRLITIEFFAYNDEHGIIETRICPNTAMNRRVFWYWWQRDVHAQDEDEPKPQYFTERWKVMDVVYVGKINVSCIGRLVCKWLSVRGNLRPITASILCVI